MDELKDFCYIALLRKRPWLRRKLEKELEDDS